MNSPGSGTAPCLRNGPGANIRQNSRAVRPSASTHVSSRNRSGSSTQLGTGRSWVSASCSAVAAISASHFVCVSSTPRSSSCLLALAAQRVEGPAEVAQDEPLDVVIGPARLDELRVVREPERREPPVVVVVPFCHGPGLLSSGRWWWRAFSRHRVGGRSLPVPSRLAHAVREGALARQEVVP